MTGGAGFANADIHATIRTDIIQGDGIAGGTTLNQQGLPFVLHDLVGAGASIAVEWDTRPPADLLKSAQSLSATAKAIVDLSAALKPSGRQLDVSAVCAKYSVPLLEEGTSETEPDELEPPPALPAAGPLPNDDQPFAELGESLDGPAAAVGNMS